MAPRRAAAAAAVLVVVVVVWLALTTPSLGLPAAAVFVALLAVFAAGRFGERASGGCRMRGTTPIAPAWVACVLIAGIAVSWMFSERLTGNASPPDYVGS